MKPYLEVLEAVIEEGQWKGNRTGIRTKALFSEKFRCDLRDGFPLLTTKKINFSKVAGELFAFLTGADSVEKFQYFDCDIWDPWGLEEDFYRLRNATVEDNIQFIADTKQISIDEASKIAAEITEKEKAWQTEYNNAVHDLSQGKVDAHVVQEIMANSPKSLIQYVRQLNGSSYKREIIYPKGYLGPVYGKQWIEWKTSQGELINQLKRIADQLENTPYSRRIVLTGWNPEVIPDDKYETYPDGRPVTDSSSNIQASILHGKQALPPCHLLTILNVSKGEFDPIPTINLHLTMRSTDVPIGLPFNIASYALLLSIIAKQYGMIAGELVIEMVDCHIYEDQLELAKLQLERTPTQLPTLELPEGILFDDPSTLTRENFEKVVAGLKGYEPQKFIKYPVAV